MRVASDEMTARRLTPVFAKLKAVTTQKRRQVLSALYGNFDVILVLFYSCFGSTSRSFLGTMPPRTRAPWGVLHLAPTRIGR